MEKPWKQLPLNEETGELASTTVETIPYGDQFVHVDGEYNANGIEVRSLQLPLWWSMTKNQGVRKTLGCFPNMMIHFFS